MTKIMLAAAAFAVAARAEDVTFGGLTFRLPERGAGISVVENGKATRLFHTNLSFSDESGRRPLSVDWTATNKVERLETLPGRSAWRVTFTLKDADALQCSAVYRFVDGTPGVAVTEEIAAVRPVRIHSWNMTTACGDDRRRFWYDAGFKTPEGTILYAAYGKPLSCTEGTLLGAGRSIAMTHSAGVAASDADAARLERLRDRAVCDGRGGPVLVCRLNAPAPESGPDWDALPVVAERRDTRDYRPLASNQWNGPDDLSFTLKAAWDDGWLHLLVDVSDDIAVNRHEGNTLYIGDSLQFGIDPLTEKLVGADYIDLLAAVAGSGPRMWCNSHGDPAFIGDAAGVVRNRSRLRDGGIVYDLSMPWRFLAPFKPEAGSFGMSFAVVDQDAGPGYETWMPLTDGVFGGRDCAKFAEFALEGVADLSDGAVRGEAALCHSREDLLALHSRVAALADAFGAKCAALEAAGRRDDYLAAVLEMARHFLAFEREDLDADKTWVGGKAGEIPVSDVKRAFIHSRFHANLSYLEKLLPEMSALAGETLSGVRAPVRFVEYPKGERPRMADGGFRCGGRELLLYGPNTWVAGEAWKGRHGQIATMARTGFNLFNLFNAAEPLRSELMRLAEREGVYCSFSSTTDERLTLDEEAWDAFWEKADANPRSSRAKFGCATPNMVFQVGFPEQFGRSRESTGDWDEGFRAYLKGKFGGISEVNAELGTSFADFGEIDFSAALANPALKYESMIHRLDEHIARETPHLDFKRRRFDGLPVSCHFSSHWNVAGLDPLVTLADFERVWGMFDVVGYDGGCSPVSSEFLIDFASGCIDVDLARSFHPGKPVANNEDHVIPDGVYRRYGDAESYLASALPFFLGQNAASLWVWQPRFHGDGEYAFTMANAYHASLRVAADLRRAPEEIASFRRTPDPPFRILHSVPSMADRDAYVRSLYGLYAGCSFSGWAVRFLSERMVDAGDFRGAKIVVVPDARRVGDATFAALEAFARGGGRVVAFGPRALLANEHGRPRPEREAKCAALFRRESKIATEDYAAVLGEELARAGAEPAAAVTGEGGGAHFGVVVREGRTADGRRTLLAANVLKEEAGIVVPGRWRDVLRGGEVSGSVRLAAGEVRVFSAQP